MNYSEELKKWCEKTIAFLKWDLEKEEAEYKEKGSRRIYMDEDLKRATYKALYEADINAGRGIASLYNRIFLSKHSYNVGFSDYFGYSKIEDFNESKINNYFDFAIHLKNLIELHKSWDEGEFQSILRSISNTNKFDFSKIKVDPEILESINKLVNNNSFKVYKYVDTGEEISSNDNFYISKLVGMSSDLTQWFSHIKTQQEFLEKQSDNDIFVTLFGKIDEVHPIYSNWVLTFHKKGTIWVVSDQLSFDNPNQKLTRLGRRSIWREVDSKYGDCDLPYELFHNLDEIRKENNHLTKQDHLKRIVFKPQHRQYDVEEIMKEFKNVLNSENIKYDVAYDNSERGAFRRINEAFAKKGGRIVAYWKYESDEIIIYNKPEIMFYNFEKITSNQKVFLVLLVHEIIQFASAEDFNMPKIMLAHEFINQKLLEGAKIDPTNKETTRMTYWTDSAKAMFDEIIETLDEDESESTALALKSYDLVLGAKEYDSSWLATPEKLESLSEWLVLDDEATDVRVKQKKLTYLHEEGWKWLYKTMNEKYNDILKKITYSEEYKFICKDGFSGTFNSKPKTVGGGGIHRIERKKKSVEDKRGWGIGKESGWEEYCLNCESYESKSVARIQIHHYKELLWLLDLKDRKQLHKYFRNYRIFNLIGYTGNSLLDQTHPYLRIVENDPCSRRHTNGMTIDFFICGNCFKTVKKNTQKKEVTIKYKNV